MKITTIRSKVTVSPELLLMFSPPPKKKLVNQNHGSTVTGYPKMEKRHMRGIVPERFRPDQPEPLRQISETTLSPASRSPSLAIRANYGFAAMNHRFPQLALLILSLVLLPTSRAAESNAWPSYEDWRSACVDLPANRTLLGRFPSKDILPLKSFEDFEPALDAFFKIVTNGPMATASNWIGTAPEKDVFFDTQRAWFLNPPIPFQPFAQKLQLPAGAKIVVQGDLHGDIRSLLKVLDQLNDTKWLDGFKITDPKHYMIYTGDFTDRGAYGIEVLYTLFRLKIANPEQVHFSRGNHEDFNLAARYGFFAELQAKYGRNINLAKLLRSYDFLPVVIYVGTEFDFVQMNHGGMEPGYHPGELISSPGTERFQLIEKLYQKTYREQHADWLGDDPSSVSIAEANFSDFAPTSPTTPSVLGFMWNDFTIFEEEPAFGYDPGRAFVYGKTATQHVLKTGSTSKFKIHAVLRAHQHSGIDNPMMRRLVASDGAFRHWQDTDKEAYKETTPPRLREHLDVSPERSIPEGSVWTFNVAPDSVYGMGCNFDFVTYGTLSLAPEFKDWKLGVTSIVVK